MRIHLTCPPSERFIAGFEKIREEFRIPHRFTAPVSDAATRAAGRSFDPARGDRRDLDLVTIDPAGSRDLDQAFHAERRGNGYRVHYAIADVAHFVTAGDVIDQEARNRGITYYSPDRKDSLHPDVLNQGAASLLPGVDRPALLWSLDLDDAGALADASVVRTIVRSRAALSYEDVQSALDRATPHHTSRLLNEIGDLRQAREISRGGVSLNLPGQEVIQVDDHFELQYRSTMPVENWNAQISLMTGMAAARMMLDGGVGLLRVLPPPEKDTLRWLRRSSRALGVPYAEGTTYGDWVRSLDSALPSHAALLTQAARGFRGAGYVGFEGAAPDRAEHAAIASPYAHVTAPLRRLIDRFANEIVLALCVGAQPPGWVREALEEVPDVMTETSAHGRRFEKALIDFAEAVVLSDRVGDRFTAVVTSSQDGRLTLHVRETAVIARVKSTAAALGDVVDVQLVGVDADARRVEFELV